MKPKAWFEIGGICACMTQAQADRWNGGCTTDYDLDTIRVSLPDEWEQGSSMRDGGVIMHSPRLNRASRDISLRRALCARLCPDIAGILEGASANRIG